MLYSIEDKMKNNKKKTDIKSFTIGNYDIVDNS